MAVVFCGLPRSSFFSDVWRWLICETSDHYIYRSLQAGFTEHTSAFQWHYARPLITMQCRCVWRSSLFTVHWWTRHVSLACLYPAPFGPPNLSVPKSTTAADNIEFVWLFILHGMECCAVKIFSLVPLIKINDKLYSLV